MKDLLMGMADGATVAGTLAVGCTNPRNYEMAIMLIAMIVILMVCSSPIVTITNKIAGD